MNRRRGKFSLPMLILASITLILSSYGLYALAHDYGNIPTGLAILAIGGFDLFAVAAGNHAMTIAEDGDSAGPWNLAVIGAAILSSVLQYAHTQLDGQPWPVGVMMAMFPIATVLLFEGTLRRAHRLNGRRTGRVAEPRATFELVQWLFYFRATMTAFRYGVADRSLGGDAAFKLGMLETKPPEITYVPPKRANVTLQWGQIIPGLAQRAELTGQSAGLSGGESTDKADAPPERPTIKALVRASMQVNGSDRAAIIEDVQAERPEASEGTIRRTIRRLEADNPPPDDDDEGGEVRSIS